MTHTHMTIELEIRTQEYVTIPRAPQPTCPRFLARSQAASRGTAAAGSANRGRTRRCPEASGVLRSRFVGWVGGLAPHSFGHLCLRARGPTKSCILPSKSNRCMWPRVFCGMQNLLEYHFAREPLSHARFYSLVCNPYYNSRFVMVSSLQPPSR